MSDLIRLTGLWMNEGKDGEKHMQGSLGGARLFVFKNKHKKSDSDPDYVACVAPKQQQQDGDSKAAENHEDIPF